MGFGITNGDVDSSQPFFLSTGSYNYCNWNFPPHSEICSLLGRWTTEWNGNEVSVATKELSDKPNRLCDCCVLNEKLKLKKFSHLECIWIMSIVEGLMECLYGWHMKAQNAVGKAIKTDFFNSPFKCMKIIWDKRSFGSWKIYEKLSYSYAYTWHFESFYEFS